MKGDIVTLKAFCSNSVEALGDTKSLAALVKQTGKERVAMKKSKGRIAYKKVWLGWTNFDQGKQKYVSIRASRGGGGTRTESFRNGATKEMITKKMKDMFFVDGKNAFGRLSDFVLGNFKGQIVCTGNNSFNLSDYIKDNKLVKTRLYLMSKKKCHAQWIDDIYKTED